MILPRVFSVALFLFLLSGSVSLFGQTVVVRSTADLRKLGISVERLNNDTPMASVQIGSLVEPQGPTGEYDHTECVVLSAAAEGARLAQADAGMLREVTIVRRTESSKARSVFLVLGKDLPNAYLAFQFTVRESEETRLVRYLYPVGKISPRRE